MNMEHRDLITRMARTRPLMLASILCLLGCTLAYTLKMSVAICCACIAAFLFVILLFRKKRVAAILLFLAFIPLGALRFSVDWSLSAPMQEQKKATLIGRICEIPVWNEETERTICVLDNFSINDARNHGKLRLYLRGDIALLQQVQLGQTIVCSAHIWRADEASNPGEFNFSNYLRLNGLRGYATAEIEKSELSAPSYRLCDWSQRLRAVLRRRIERLFPNNSAIACAFLLGDRSELTDEDRQSYSISGAAHLLAISGMHVSVLAGFINHIFGRFFRKRTAFWITLASLLCYGALIGFSASIFRAILMYAVYHAAPLTGRYSDPPTRIAAAMFVFLLIRPMAILDSGFVLSCGASSGIIFLFAPLTRLFRTENLLSGRPKAEFTSLFTHRLPRWIVQSLLVTLAAQLAILPAVVHYFGSQPLWSFAVNLIAIPLAMCAYILAIVSMLSGLSFIALLSDALFSLLTICVRFFSQLPMSSIGIAHFPLWLTLICVIACFCASDLCNIPQKIKSLLPFTVILAIFVSNACAYIGSGGCSIVFLDAGEADCAVIRSDHQIYLIDTGDKYSPAASYLSANNYSVDGIFLSHPHADHAGGLDSILDYCVPERIYLSANWNYYEMDEGINEALVRAQSLGSEIISISAGDHIALSDETLLEVLSPRAGFPADSANDDSLILRLRYGDCSAVFTGDASAKAAYGHIDDIDLLKAAHHGGGDSLSAALLKDASPSVVMIPVGYNNYGHPAQQTLELLQAAQTRVYRADLHGAVRCKLHKDGSISVRSYKNPEE